MKKAFTIIILFLFTLPVFAADWVEISYKTYIDKSSIKRDYNGVTSWIKILNDGNMENISNKKVWYKILNNTFNCSNKTYKNNSYNVYGLNGTVLYSDNYSTEWETIIPDSNAEYWHSLLCK